jgi:hypothetical protein
VRTLRQHERNGLHVFSGGSVFAGRTDTPTLKDLEPYIGSRARVAEVLNRVRPLTLEMIRRLSEGLNIPADVLVRRYALTEAA